MSYNDIRATEPPYPTPVNQDDYDALAARLAEEESAHRVTAGIFASTLVRADAAEARLAEAVRMIEGYKRAGWLTNPATIEQANDFIARVQSATVSASGVDYGSV